MSPRMIKCVFGLKYLGPMGPDCSGVKYWLRKMPVKSRLVFSTGH